MSQLPDDDQKDGQVFTNPGYSSDLLSQFHEFYSKQLFTDVVLVCKDKLDPLETNTSPAQKLKCHKLVLASLSPYFVAMFSSCMSETISNLVQMPTADFSVLQEIVTYAYTGKLKICISNVQSLFSLASLLQINDIVLACSDFMKTHLDVSNCLEVLTFANVHSCQDLIDKTIAFVRQNFSELSKTDEFLQFDEPALIAKIIDSDALDLDLEETLVDAITDWTCFDFSARSLEFGRLFDAVRLDLLTNKNYVRSYLDAHEKLLDANPKCQEGLKRILNDSQPKTISNKRIGMLKADYCFLLLGGNLETNAQHVDCFNPYNGEKYVISSNFRGKSKYSSKGFFHIENPGIHVTDSNRVFLAGGNYVFHSNARAAYYENGQRDSRILAQLSDSSSSDESGQPANETLNKEVFEYDCQNDVWVRKASMLFAKSNFSLCSMNDTLYSFGGIVSGHVQSDVIESYDIANNQWSYVGTMPNPFVAGCVVRHEDAFYILGGRCGVGKFNNCFKYVPETREWSELRGMRVGRFNFGAIVMSQKIYVFGGQRYDESEDSFFTREALDSVEVYDIQADQWFEGTKMPSPLYNTGVGQSDASPNSVYVCGTTECKYSGSRLMGFMFTSVFRMDVLNEKSHQLKWTVVEHDVSEIKSNYRCAAARVSTRKLKQIETNIVVNGE